MTAAALRDRLNLSLTSVTGTGSTRQRWQSRHLIGRPVLAARLSMIMGGKDDVGHAEANPRTGRILLRDVKVPAAQIEPEIRAALHKLLLEEIRTKITLGPDELSTEPIQLLPALKQVTNPLKANSPQDGAFRELLKQFPPDKREFVKATSYSLGNTLVNFAPELALIAIVNIVNGKKIGLLTKIGLGTIRGQVLTMGLAAGAAFAFELYVERNKRRKWRNLARMMEHEVRTETYDHLQRMDMAHIDRKSSGEHLNLLWDATGKIRTFMESGADDMLQRIFVAVIIVATLGFVSPLLALTTLAPLPIIIAGSRYVSKRVEEPYAIQQKCEELIQKFLSANLIDLSVIKSFTAEDIEAEKLNTLSAQVRDTSSMAHETSSQYTDLMRLLISVSFALAVMIGGFLVARKSITASMFTLILFFVPKLLVRMEGMGVSYDQYKLANQSARAILDELGASAEIHSGPVHLPRESVAGAINFRNLDFGYSADRKVLENFNMEIPAGSTVAIVGSTGAGKSTVIRLINRFYDPLDGAVELDGLDLREANLTDLRRNIATVSQETFLFDMSVRENILFGRPDATDEEVIEAAKAAEAHEFIVDLAQGYETRIGERGKALSGGQRQRIAIARAILKDAPILIFDEATSAVDNETEAAIQRSIDAFAKDRTAILIAHRLSTVRNADCIHVMSHGNVVESGTHDALIKQNGIYAELWRVQTGEAVNA